MDANITWCAGILEGEGYFGVSGNSKSPRITCEMTDLDVLEKLQSILGGVITVQKVRNVNYKQSWRWLVQNKEAVQIMILLRQHLLSRRQLKIDIILTLWFDKQELIKTRQELLNFAHDEWLNGRGSLRQLAKIHRFSSETIRKGPSGARAKKR